MGKTRIIWIKGNGQAYCESTQAYLGSKSTTISTTLYNSQKAKSLRKVFLSQFPPFFLRRFGQKVECWVCRNEWASHFRVAGFWSLIVSKKIYEVNLIEIINQKGKDWRISLINHFCSMQLICFISLGIIYERIFNRNFKIL